MTPQPKTQNPTQDLALLKNLPDKPILLDPIAGWCIMAQLQLALRHPDNQGPTAEIARHFARHLQQWLAITPTLLTIAQAGWQTGQE